MERLEVSVEHRWEEGHTHTPVLAWPGRPDPEELCGPQCGEWGGTQYNWGTFCCVLVPTGEPGQFLDTAGCGSPNFAEGLTCPEPLTEGLRVPCPKGLAPVSGEARRARTAKRGCRVPQIVLPVFSLVRVGVEVHTGT